MFISLQRASGRDRGRAIGASDAPPADVPRVGFGRRRTVNMNSPRQYNRPFSPFICLTGVAHRTSEGRPNVQCGSARWQSTLAQPRTFPRSWRCSIHWFRCGSKNRGGFPGSLQHRFRVHPPPDCNTSAFQLSHHSGSRAGTGRLIEPTISLWEQTGNHPSVQFHITLPRRVVSAWRNPTIVKIATRGHSLDQGEPDCPWREPK